MRELIREHITVSMVRINEGEPSWVFLWTLSACPTHFSIAQCNLPEAFAHTRLACHPQLRKRRQAVSGNTEQE